MVQARYQYAIDVMLTRLRMIDADLTEKNERPLIRNLCSRIKTAESIVKKLERKEQQYSDSPTQHNGPRYGCMLREQEGVGYPSMIRME